MRLSHINELISACSTEPYGNSVNSLISLFKRTDNVSFVYIMHRLNSGFVTFRKSRKLSNTQEVFMNNNEVHYKTKQSVENWRNSLKFAGSNDILVAFAWSHDNELRCTEMYPEFLCVDVTFGV